MIMEDYYGKADQSVGSNFDILLKSRLMKDMEPDGFARYVWKCEKYVVSCDFGDYYVITGRSNDGSDASSEYSGRTFDEAYEKIFK